jgi:CBS-domain-containing membrane protein
MMVQRSATAATPEAAATPATGGARETAGARAERWRSKAPGVPDFRTLLRFTVVAVAGLLTLVVVGEAFHTVLLTPPLAATAVIIAGAPSTPPAQPRSVLAGHICAAVLGLVAVVLFGSSPWTAAVAGGLSLGVMALLRAVHAPAAATAALIVAQHPAVLRTMGSFVAGSVLLILIGIVAARLFREARYPDYWW